MEENESTFLARGASRVSPFFVPMMMPNAAAGMISIRFGFTGPALCISTACAAGANAIGEGVRMVRDGSAEVVVAGATEAPVTPAHRVGVRPHGRDEHAQRRSRRAPRVRSTPPATAS